jgi:uncharacterized protein
VIGTALPGESHYLLLHGYTGAVDKVAAGLGRLLAERRGDAIEPERDLADVPDGVRRSLVDRGYLTDLDHEAERTLVVSIAATLHDRDLRENPTGFMLIPTYRCNLRCPYCFQSHVMHAGRGSYAEVMTRERVEQAFGVIDDFDHPGAVGRALGIVPDDGAPAEARAAVYAHKVGLFGGEPLSQWTESVVPYIVESAQRRGKTVSAITNGVELDRFSALLGPGAIDEVQITLDGSKGRHDSRRIGPGFRETFETIVANIELALERGVAVRTRINVDSENLDALADLRSLFMSKGWVDHEGFWAHAAAVHSMKQPVGGQTQKLLQITPKRQQRFEPADLVRETMARADEEPDGYAIRSYEKDADELLAACVTSDEYPFRRSVFCAAATGSLIFDPFGDVYSCWEEVGDASYRIAQYGGTGIEFDRQVGTQWLTRFPGAIEECSNCPYALIHTSGCAAHARQENGTYFSSACESFKSYFPETLAHSWTRFERSLLRDGKELQPVGEL